MVENITNKLRVNSPRLNVAVSGALDSTAITSSMYLSKALTLGTLVSSLPQPIYLCEYKKIDKLSSQSNTYITEVTLQRIKLRQLLSPYSLYLHFTREFGTTPWFYPISICTNDYFQSDSILVLQDFSGHKSIPKTILSDGCNGLQDA